MTKLRLATPLTRDDPDGPVDNASAEASRRSKSGGSHPPALPANSSGSGSSDGSSDGEGNVYSTGCSNGSSTGSSHDTIGLMSSGSVWPYEPSTTCT
jgi:hypothetical protein